jgi:starch-binding outer membrane protein, SusD/RagB family
MPEFRKAENDYLIAEAALRTNKVQEAADVMNASARVTRGNLPPLPANEAQIAAAIHYERMVELMLTGMGNEYFQMRKESKLQPGTILHFPSPDLSSM